MCLIIQILLPSWLTSDALMMSCVINQLGVLVSEAFGVVDKAFMDLGIVPATVKKPSYKESYKSNICIP